MHHKKEKTMSLLFESMITSFWSMRFDDDDVKERIACRASVSDSKVKKMSLRSWIVVWDSMGGFVITYNYL